MLIQIEYRIDPENREAFLRAMRAIGPVRRRNGANSWRVFRDLAEDGLFVERYIIELVGGVRAAALAHDDRRPPRRGRPGRHQREGVHIRVSRFLGVDLPAGGARRIRAK